MKHSSSPQQSSCNRPLLRWDGMLANHEVLLPDAYRGLRPFRIRTTSAVHFDPENTPNFIAAAECIWKTVLTARRAPGDPVRVLDLGCGCGVWGLIQARLAPAETAYELHFTDVDPVSRVLVDLNCKANLPGMKYKSFVGDMFAALLGEAPYDVILFNPPQTGGPLELGRKRPDKYGGADGSLYYTRLARECGAFVRDTSVLVVSQIGLANSTVIRYELGGAGGRGFTLSEIAWQSRQFARYTLDGILPGLFDYQLRSRAAGTAAFVVDGENPDQPFAAGDLQAITGRMLQHILMFSQTKSCG